MFILAIYTLVHFAISLIAIVARFVVLFGLIVGKQLDRSTYPRAMRAHN